MLWSECDAPLSLRGSKWGRGGLTKGYTAASQRCSLARPHCRHSDTSVAVLVLPSAYTQEGRLRSYLKTLKTLALLWRCSLCTAIMLILLVKHFLYQKSQGWRTCSISSLTIYVATRSSVEQSSLQVNILFSLLNLPLSPHQFEINKNHHIKISSNAEFPLGESHWETCTVSLYDILFQRTAPFFTPSSGLTEAWHPKKLPSFPRKSLHNIFSHLSETSLACTALWLTNLAAITTFLTTSVQDRRGLQLTLLQCMCFS